MCEKSGKEENKRNKEEDTHLESVMRAETATKPHTLERTPCSGSKAKERENNIGGGKKSRLLPQNLGLHGSHLFLTQRRQAPHLLRLLGIKPPQATRLVSVAGGGDINDRTKRLENGVRAFRGGEVPPLPDPALLSLLGTEVALGLLNLALLDGDGVQIALEDGFSDFGPGATRLERVLLFGGGDAERGDGVGCGIVRLDLGLGRVGPGRAPVKVGALGPHAAGVVEDVLLVGGAVQDGADRVFLAREPALA